MKAGKGQVVKELDARLRRIGVPREQRAVTGHPPFGREKCVKRISAQQENLSGVFCTYPRVVAGL